MSMNRRAKAHYSSCAVHLLVFVFLLCLLCLIFFLVKWIIMPDPSSVREHTKSASDNHNLENPDPAITAADRLPVGWVEQQMGSEAIHHGTLVLVNSDYGFVPDAASAVSVWEHKNTRYLVKDIYLSLDPAVIDWLNAWMEAFFEETGCNDVNVVAGYRSIEDQQQLYDNAVLNKGQSHADRYLALPGHSEHHTGLALDLNIVDVENGTSRDFVGSGDYIWATDHAWEYGFVQRYPVSKSSITGIDYESWHYRYVGLPHAWYMWENNLCLEEYIALLSSYPFDGEHLFVECKENRYEIYFCPGSIAVVPEQGEYTVSGNNVDGLIVTVTLH